MASWQSASLVVLGAIVGVGGVLVAPYAGSLIAPAYATDPPATAPDASATADASRPPAMDDGATVGASSGQLVCQVFATDVRTPTPIDTADATTEIGQWVSQWVAQGYALFNLDFEVGSKSTGYPQGYVQVCMYPAV